MLFPADMIEVTNSIVPTSVSSAASATKGTGVDLSKYENAVLVRVNSTAPGSGTVTFTVQTADVDSDASYAAVDATDLVDPSTGANATFTVAASGTPVAQTLAIKKQNVGRYIRVVATPASTPTCVFHAAVIAARKYTDA